MVRKKKQMSLKCRRTGDDKMPQFVHTLARNKNCAHIHQQENRFEHLRHREDP